MPFFESDKSSKKIPLRRYRYGLTLLLAFFVFSGSIAEAQIKTNFTKSEGWKITVNDNPIFIKGINWDYFPIGTNYEYSLWNQADPVIVQVLEDEMSLLHDMGANAIRVYTPMPKKWISYIHEEFGIYTILNHSFGRYGLLIDGNWYPRTNYGDPKVRSVLLEEIRNLALEYRETPGLLVLLIGNENNYGLFWEGAETEDMPEDSNTGIEHQARQMYRLFNEAAQVMKANNFQIPVAMCNGDLQFLSIIAEECKDIDIFGINSYRGASFGNLFEEVRQKLNKPVLLTEFGSDAFNAILQEEAQDDQALILAQNWKEIYQNAARMGNADNSIGGMTFQFSDGWWKHGQTTNLDVQDPNASWSNGGYGFDFKVGIQNMNEEWFGICAKQNIQPDGSYILQPRKAYYLIQKIHQIDPCQPNVDRDYLSRFFELIEKPKGSN